MREDLLETVGLRNYVTVKVESTVRGRNMHSLKITDEGTNSIPLNNIIT